MGWGQWAGGWGVACGLVRRGRWCWLAAVWRGRCCCLAAVCVSSGVWHDTDVRRGLRGIARAVTSWTASHANSSVTWTASHANSSVTWTASHANSSVTWTASHANSSVTWTASHAVALRWAGKGARGKAGLWFARLSYGLVGWLMVWLAGLWFGRLGHGLVFRLLLL